MGSPLPLPEQPKESKRGCCMKSQTSCNSPFFVPLPPLARSPFPVITGKA